jgi:dTDP-4-dehydrorhamnose reductase
MKALILGGGGMLGHKLFQVLGEAMETWASFQEAGGPWSRLALYRDSGRAVPGVNALEFATVAAAIRQLRPTVVVNCIGVVKQLASATDPVLSLSINSLLPQRLAQLRATEGFRLVHLSTDCVFSGRKGSYVESDAADPEDLYGHTKLLGEVNGTGCLTVRTSMIGRELGRSTGLLEWFLAQRGRRVRGYRNAIYTGFTTLALARILRDIIVAHPALTGLYHVASPALSKYDLLVRMRDALGLNIEVEPYDDPPYDRSLSPARFVAATGCSLPGWDEMIADFVSDPTPYEEWRRLYAAP